MATGKSFPANISDDLGAFGIQGKTDAPYFELRAEGYYFNETTGSISSNPLYLEAFVKSDDSASNVNLMITAIRPRVKSLIRGGKSYDEAVSQAQGELVNELGFTGNAGNFDDMDITGTLSHFLETKPVRQPVPVQAEMVYWDSIVFRDRVVREDIYIDRPTLAGVLS